MRDTREGVGVAASPPGHSDEPASSLAADAGSVPNAERLKLDRRIHNQRVALRDNWMIVEQRTAGQRRMTLGIIRRASRLCDVAGIPTRSADGIGWLGIHERMRRLEARLAQGTSAREGQDRNGLEAKPAGPVAESHAPKL